MKEITEYPFKNEYGEMWVVVHNYQNDTTVMAGQDIDWLATPLVNEKALDMFMSKFERSFIKLLYQHKMLGTSPTFNQFKKDRNSGKYDWVEGCQLTSTPITIDGFLVS